MKRFRLSVLIYLTLVFLSGVLVGVLGHRLYTVQSVRARPGPRSPEEMRRQYVEDLRTRLKLSDDQINRLTEVLDATGKRFHEVSEKWRPELRAIQDEQTEKIRAILDPAQRNEFEKMRQEREQRRHRGRSGPGPGPGGGPGPGPGSGPGRGPGPGRP